MSFLARRERSGVKKAVLKYTVHWFNCGTLLYFCQGKDAVVRVKICGITSFEEARMAISCGADAVGFLIGLNYPTDDEIDTLAAKEIIASLPPFVSSVLVTHKKELDWVVDTCQRLGCNTIQLHGDFAVEQIPLLRSKVPYSRIIKAVHVP